MIKTELTEFGLEVQNLRKVYKGNNENEPVVALKRLDLQVKKGSFFGKKRLRARRQVFHRGL